MADHKTLAATSLLASMLSGLPHTGGEMDPTFSLDNITSDGAKVSTTLELPTGDRFAVSVEWLSDQSP